MATAIEREMAKLAALGITVNVKLASGVPESERPSTLIRDVAKKAGVYYEQGDADV